MIPNDISYTQVHSVAEALKVWREHTAAGDRVRYFSGGTELITRARERAGEFDALIDVKRIPECASFDPRRGIIGAATRLTALSDQSSMPMVAAAARGIADRTARNSVTFAGNICSMLAYRECLLPLLLFDATLKVAEPREGTIGEIALSQAFEKRLLLPAGGLLLGAAVPDAVGRTGFYRRRTRDARVDYPIVGVAMARSQTGIRLAIGGAYGYPIRSVEAEAAIAASLAEAGFGESAAASSSGKRPAVPSDAARKAAEAGVATIPDRLRDDMRSSAEYRRELLLQAIAEGICELARGEASA